MSRYSGLISEHDITLTRNRRPAPSEPPRGADDRTPAQDRLATSDYAQLAAFRRVLRSFLRFSELAAAEVGLTAQHYQAMLIIRSCPRDEHVSISDLAAQLLIKHNSAVGLVDRLEQQGLMVRRVSKTDRRKIELRLTRRGRDVLGKLAAVHRSELQRIGPHLQRFFQELEALKVQARDARRSR